MWPLAVLNINEVAPLMGFSYEKMHGRFAGKKILTAGDWPY